ncbi:TetR/AcrR family transcriptional regulator [Aerobium aerolatum]|uniref:Transcriptional regulator, TetR family n=1 Tax=Aquamicrobium aerolatum DSM 21857 TaxID=1121003 RepID=A0A1I3H982_9HYPH|nr:TetR/AcrR family transcriptional regulator [Aquamicrobium aerolatum]SFI32295.1 transcriptional regulator, TetR family [Aquamicrobium aerolatum DSM 21857]
MPKETVRSRLLRAAEELTHVNGAGNMSLDAVAARAGVSKGGLLYHFPTKAKLLEALVERFIEQFEAELAARIGTGSSQSGNVGAAVVEMFVQERSFGRPPPSGLLAALAENPEFIEPIRKQHTALLERIQSSARDRTDATIAYLALQGIRSNALFDFQHLPETIFDDVVARLRQMVRD